MLRVSAGGIGRNPAEQGLMSEREAGGEVDKGLRTISQGTLAK